MKKDIHPKYTDCTIKCSCGNVIETRATKESLHTELCSACHPFFTGKQKFVDAAGRVEKFQQRYGTAWKNKQAKTPAKVVAGKKSASEAAS